MTSVRARKAISDPVALHEARLARGAHRRSGAHRDEPVTLDRAERVGEPDAALVERMVVRQRQHVEARAGDRCEQRLVGLEDHLAATPPVLGYRRLEVRECDVDAAHRGFGRADERAVAGRVERAAGGVPLIGARRR